jgi:hypothetical protein
LASRDEIDLAISKPVTPAGKVLALPSGSCMFISAIV